MHSLEQLELLQQKAIQNAKQRRKQYRKIKWLYRDKSLEYMTNAKEEQVMTVYVKDKNGDPRSPINNRLYGLHFQANVQYKTGKPMPCSPFGNHRMLIPANYMMQLCPKLYFADFYCLQRGIHHVTLVLTRQGSKADRFCSKYLLELDTLNNPFFRHKLDKYGNPCMQVLNNGIWIEAFFTEDVDMVQAKLNGMVCGDVRQTCKRKGPKPKDKSCQVCNI